MKVLLAVEDPFPGVEPVQMGAQDGEDFQQYRILIHGLRQGLRFVGIEGQAGVVDVRPGDAGESCVGHFKPLNGIKRIG